MNQWDSTKGMKLPTFKGVELPTLDGLTTNLDSLASNMAKLDSLTLNTATFKSFDANLAKLDMRVLTTGNCGDLAAGFVPDYLKEFRRASSSLNQAQRGWLSKGLRDWNSYIAKSLNWLAIEVKKYPDDGAFDLRTFLHRRQLRGLHRRARWAGRSKGIVRAWLRELGEDLLSRVAAGLRTGSGSKALLSLLKAPPGWTAAIRLRLTMEAALPKILEQLAEVLAPNAPSISPEPLLVHGGIVA